MSTVRTLLIGMDRCQFQRWVLAQFAILRAFTSSNHQSIGPQHFDRVGFANELGIGVFQIVYRVVFRPLLMLQLHRFG